MFDIFKDIFKRKARGSHVGQMAEEKKMEDDGYYHPLLQKYGDCKVLAGHVSILMAADLHGKLTEDRLEAVSVGHYDACMLLGDLSFADVLLMVEHIHAPIYGIYGNHDEKGVYEQFGIVDLAHAVVMLNGIRFAGFEGAPRYKPNMIGYTQEESLEIGLATPVADVVISHASPFDPHIRDNVHCGFKGVSEYIYRNRVPYCFYGHDHEPQVGRLSNGCRTECIYGIKVVEI